MIRYNTSLKASLPSFDNRKLFLKSQQPAYWKMALVKKYIVCIILKFISYLNNIIYLKYIIFK